MGGFAVLTNWPAIGSRYEGQIDEKGLPHGKGVLKFQPRGSKLLQIYEGNFCRGERHGRGLVLYSSGAVLEGEFRRNEPHFGVYRWASGAQFTGHFQGAKCHTPEGETSMKREVSGATIFGCWVDGTLQGWTAVVLPDSYYYCFIQNDWRQAEITTFWWNGDVLTATFLDNSRIGPAHFVWPNGDEWRGTFHSHNYATGVKTEESTGKRIPLLLECCTTEKLGETKVIFLPIDQT